MAFTGIFWKYHTGVKPLQPLMLHKAKNEYILHIAEEAKRKKMFCKWAKTMLSVEYRTSV